MRERFVCVHGHFYQPPRENPWLESIELQDSAYPYHDWNERITAQCYAPNSASRILDADGRILHVVNNYSRINFNFGPTLLAWLEWASPATYQSILDADRLSRDHYSNHGSAIAQGYNHIILPLANSRDKRTQILWGIRDFQHRFQRDPEGMWLPETAVDTETLEILAECGIRYTILSPYQAARVREPRGHWRDVSNARVDPSTPYRVNLPSGRSITVFFYDGPISRALAFEDLLTRGENLAARLLGAFHDKRPWPQLVHIATDGETYGHHRQLGDMGLAYCLHSLDSTPNVRLTNYGEFLERFPPQMEAEVFDNSSWSCIHGVERWRSHCGCNTGMRHGWSQHWRGPLREALDWLRDELACWFDRKGAELFLDHWAARDAYIDVILDRSPENVDRFFTQHARRPLSPSERVLALQLLEIQRHAMLMYTSCGWFFDDLSGIETVQVIQYAGRAIQLAEQILRKGIEEEFLALLERARGNVPEHPNGRAIYESSVRPAMIDLHKVGAHYAISSLFEDYGESTQIFSHLVEREDGSVLHAGKTRLTLGRARVTSRITGACSTLSYGVLHLGGQNIYGGIRDFQGHRSYNQLYSHFSDILHRGDIPELIRAVDKQFGGHFGGATFSLRLLFRDEQRRIVTRILESADLEAAAKLRELHREHATLVRFVGDLGIPLPRRVMAAIEFSLNDDLLIELSQQEPSLQRIREILAEIEHMKVPFDAVTAEFRFRRNLEAATQALAQHPESLPALQRLNRLTGICPHLPFPISLWKVQSSFWTIAHSTYPAQVKKAKQGGAAPQKWVQLVLSLADKLKIHLAPDQ